MKPKTKNQIKIAALSEKLNPATDAQINYGWNNCLDNHFYRSRKTIFCLECGHSWKNESSLVTSISGCECPECGKQLNQTLKNNYANSAYYGIITVKEDIQVVRVFWIHKWYKKGKPCFYYSAEVMQHWIDQQGNITTMAKGVQGLSMYYDQWIFQSNLEVRPKQFADCPRYNIVPCKFYPDRKVLPIFKRNGFRGNFYGIAPQIFFRAILTDPKIETLLKLNQLSLLKYAHIHNDKVKEYWNSIKICIRNGYTVKDASIWYDYLDLLKYFGRDLLNSSYVCPADLKYSHDRLVKLKRDRERRLELEERRKMIEEAQIKYAQEKAKFFGLSFRDQEIEVKVLEHVQEFEEEGEKLKHCVFQNGYYDKANSLILSARIEGEPVETIELSLSNLKLVQARGLSNKPSKYNKRIVNLVKSKIPEISRLICN